MEINELKREFLKDEFAWLSIQAAIQRSKPYKNGIDGKQRELFRSFIKNKIFDIGKDYIHEIEEPKHESNILELTDEITEKYEQILKGDHLGVGVAQKVINLYLKYLWCEGFIPKPPHCPFDRNIIEQLPKEFWVNWTEIETIDEYHKLVMAAKEIAGTEPIAVWELRKYQEIMKNEMGK